MYFHFKQKTAVNPLTEREEGKTAVLLMINNIILKRTSLVDYMNNVIYNILN